MKIIFTLFAFVLPFQAIAEVVTCSFTEPFLNVKYDPTSTTVQVHEAIEDTKNEYAVSKVINHSTDSTEVFWRDSNWNTKSLKFTVDPKGGSDGMSDFFFPMVGELTTDDPDYKLIGGCSTPSNPAVNPYESPVTGCYEVLQTQFEDGASYYTAIGEKIIAPLQARPEYKSLAEFLSSALVVRGYMTVDLELCRTLDEVVAK